LPFAPSEAQHISLIHADNVKHIYRHAQICTDMCAIGNIKHTHVHMDRQADRLTDRRTKNKAGKTYIYRHKHIFAYTISTHA